MLLARYLLQINFMQRRGSMFVLFAGAALFIVAQAKLMPAARYASLIPVCQQFALLSSLTPHGTRHYLCHRWDETHALHSQYSLIEGQCVVSDRCERCLLPQCCKAYGLQLSQLLVYFFQYWHRREVSMQPAKATVATSQPQEAVQGQRPLVTGQEADHVWEAAERSASETKAKAEASKRK